MSVFDRRQLRRSFGRAASRYTEVAALQREVEARLLEQLGYLDDRQPSRVLDLGSGPGRAAGAMKKRWPKAEVIAVDAALPMLREVPKHTRFWRPVRRVNADVSKLPFAEQCVDVIFSSLCLQWLDDLPAVLSEFRRVLRPDGLLLFSTFGPETLSELRDAYLQAGETPPLSPFAAIQQVGDAMLAAGFKDPVLDRDRYTLTYPDLRGLMRELRAIGAGDARHDRPRGLGGRGRLQRVTAHYEALRRDGVLPSTWEVITAQTWGPAPGAPRRDGGADLASFPADRIPTRRR
ncbi:malonyl-ACP O-methyltransferase BioC [Arenimonas terrae]|uniref:Malonyl-[acyl-carrier protein] O-methyltransferase n=1 Tax=Arenimonas terrae TaxID=2546226 RepID=A0A5C4RNR1_9GAMM|nr:malonyl-ACP O-methyltransferase BioC [Arenimonas terrae]TNJ32708.1 malonyl-[acyl-carrier protein] O-methyltransferase BioC [Arenimonas terrae]